MADDVSEITVPLSTLLLNAREAQGLSLEQVASQLNLSLVQLEKLESDQLNPAQLNTFERGYVRNYASLLEIEPSVIDRYFLSCDYGYRDLHSVKVYGCTTSKPLLGRLIIKWLFISVLIGLLVVLMLPVFPEFFG